MISDARSSECRAVRSEVLRWARSRPDIRAVAVVGSWARDQATMDSDLDLVVLTDEKDRDTDADGWVEAALGTTAPVVRRTEWGPLLTECRVRLGSGFELDVGFAPLAWAETDPVDAGTATVVRGGCTALHDPDGIVARLLAAMGNAV